MKRGSQESEEKKLRRIARRIDEIHKELQTRPSVPLKKKVFVGHWRYLSVRSDILRSSVGSQVKMVVDRCNNWVLGKKSVPSSYRASTEVAISATESGFTHEQGLRPLSREEWEAAEFPPHFEKKWFRRVPKIIRAGTKNIVVDRYFPQIPRHMLEYAYKPAYITETNELDGKLESELRCLYAKMRASHGWEKLQGRHLDEWDLNLKKIKHLDKEANRECREFSR